MDKQNPPKDHLTPELIKAYRTGKLSPQERNAVERLLLEDPLYAEAWEGLGSIDDHQLDNHLRSLDARIDSRLESSGKTVFWTVSRSIAATVLLLASASLVFFFIRSDPQTEALTADQILPTDEPKTKLLKDSINQAAGKSEPEGLNKRTADATPADRQSEEVEKEDDMPVVPPAETEPEEELAELVVSEETAAGEALTGQKGILELTLDLESVSDSSRHEAASRSKSRNPRPAYTLPPAEQEQDSSVVANSINPSGEDSLLLLKEATPDTKVNTRVSQPQPAIGMDRYNRYLRDSLRYPDTARTLRIRGRVTLRFTVTENGEVSDLTIIKGLGHGCDEEAIRLVREGPRWIPKTTGTSNRPVASEVTLRIRFRPPG